MSQLMDSRIASGPKNSAPDSKNNASTEEKSQQPIARKPGRPPKKPTTLTARVTARYASDYNEDKGTKNTNTANTEAARGRRKTKAKPKPQEPEFIVLSPEVAVKSLEDQDLMFGTCSQLEREDSPTTLRDMQTAINASELETNSSINKETASGSVISRFTAPRNLWSEASRDFYGALAQAEVLDLVDGCDISQISPRRDSHQLELLDGKHEEIQLKHMDTMYRKGSSQPRVNTVAVKQPSQQTGDNADKQKRATSATEESRPEMPQYSGLTDAELSKQLAAYGFKRVTKRQDKIALLQRCWESKHGTNATPNGGRRGNLQNTSTSQTDKDGKSTNVHSDSRAKSKAKSTSPADNDVPAQPVARKRQGSSPPASSSSQKPAETSRISHQEPKLHPQPKSFAHVEEIEDTEDESIPSPSRLQGRYTNLTDSRGQSLPISAAPPCPSRATSKSQSKPTTTVCDSFDEDDDELPELATQITKAVRAQSRISTSTKGPDCPSWHEKILMYDPIVLEDFAFWLNTDGLGLVAEDREVSATFVRGWCESKGICCCWKKERW